MLRARDVLRAGMPGILALATGCFNSEGLDPPLDEIYFPIASATSRDGDFLFVANSNFDLRYNGGTVQAFDLDALDEKLGGCDDEPDCEIRLDDVLVDQGSTIIGSHVSDLVVSESGSRLYVSVRGDRDLTFIDWDPDAGLDCGGSGEAPRCTADHRRGDDTIADRRGEATPPDPMGVVTGSLEDAFGLPAGSGDFVVMAHRLGQVSLFIDGVDENGDEGVLLVDTESDFPEDVVSIRFDPNGGQLWMPSTTGNVVGLAGLAIDAATDPLDAAIFNAGFTQVVGASSFSAGDLRDVVFDPREGFEDVAYLLSRSPEAVFVTHIDRFDPQHLRVGQVIDLGSGPSKLELGAFEYEDTDHLLLFASCFDASEIYVVAPDLGQVVSIVRELSGPFSLSTGSARNRLYVTDFEASVVRIVDLEPLLECLSSDAAHDSCEPRVIGSLGTPKLVSELQ